MADRVPKAQKGQGRWRAGKVPDWVQDPNVKEEDDNDIKGRQSAPAAAHVKHDATDRRLRRLAETRAGGSDEEDDEARRHRRREVREARVVVGDDDGADDEGEAEVKEEEASDSDEDQVEARRERLRMLARKRAQEQEQVQESMPIQEEEEEEAGSESSWEYESESEDDAQHRLVKPVFVSKSGRATIAERDKIDAEARAEEEARLKREEERKAETRKLVAAELHKEHQAQAEREKRQVREDTESDGNEEEEFDKWRIRELKRIKRDREERDRWNKEKADVERRRTMTDDQVMAEDRALGKGKKERGQMVFMQKYHHKGAFFMDNDESNAFKESIYNRTTNEATDADKATAKLATDGPHEGSRVLQVRRGEFGKMGQTKWTHLTAEDTTSFDSPWTQDDSIRRKFLQKGGGMAKRAEVRR